jgi:hypothetical protein
VYEGKQRPYKDRGPSKGLEPGNFSADRQKLSISVRGQETLSICANKIFFTTGSGSILKNEFQEEMPGVFWFAQWGSKGQTSLRIRILLQVLKLTSITR